MSKETTVNRATPAMFSTGVVHSKERNVHRPDNAPCLLCLRADSR